MFVPNFGEGMGGGGLTSRVMVYVKMVNESARGTTSSSEPLVFFNYFYAIASKEYPVGGGGGEVLQWREGQVTNRVFWLSGGYLLSIAQ